MTAQTRKIIKGAVEYLVLPVVETTGNDLDQPVEISIDRGETWSTAEWVGDPGPSRSARILIDTTTMTAGRYPAWLRLTDAPETPWVNAGMWTIG